MAKDQFISIRITDEIRDQFNQKCKERGIDNPSSFIREMIVAFNDDRLKIVIPENQKEVYHVN